ncbi:MAG: response regulator [Desulfurivibrio sp.]|nr:response regulator [Desulfurivibrio sp.]
MDSEPVTTAGLIPVLIVEDDEADAYLARAAFADNEMPVDLRHVMDGEEALDYLRGREPYQQAPWPRLILLDLNMPRMDGWGLLNELRADARLREIPVVIFSTSDAPEDIARGRELGATDYIVKPMYMEELNAAIKGLENLLGL